MHQGPIFNHLFVFIKCHPLFILENQITPKMNDVATQILNISPKEIL